MKFSYLLITILVLQTISSFPFDHSKFIQELKNKGKEIKELIERKKNQHKDEEEKVTQEVERAKQEQDLSNDEKEKLEQYKKETEKIEKAAEEKLKKFESSLKENLKKMKEYLEKKKVEEQETMEKKLSQYKNRGSEVIKKSQEQGKTSLNNLEDKVNKYGDKKEEVKQKINEQDPEELKRKSEEMLNLQRIKKKIQRQERVIKSRLGPADDLKEKNQREKRQSKENLLICINYYRNRYEASRDKVLESRFYDLKIKAHQACNRIQTASSFKPKQCIDQILRSYEDYSESMLRYLNFSTGIDGGDLEEDGKRALEAFDKILREECKEDLDLQRKNKSCYRAVVSRIPREPRSYANLDVGGILSYDRFIQVSYAVDNLTDMTYWENNVERCI